MYDKESIHTAHGIVLVAGSTKRNVSHNTAIVESLSCLVLFCTELFLIRELKVEQIFKY